MKIPRDGLGRFRSRILTPFDAGWDSVVRGADTTNCNFTWFSTPERTKEWENGVKEAKERTASPQQTKDKEKA